MGRLMVLLWYLAATWWCNELERQALEGPGQEGQGLLGRTFRAQLPQVRGHVYQRTQAQWICPTTRRRRWPRPSWHRALGALHSEAGEHHPEGRRKASQMRGRAAGYGGEMGGVSEGAEAFLSSGETAPRRQAHQDQCGAGGALATEGGGYCGAAGNLPSSPRTRSRRSPDAFQPKHFRSGKS